MCSNEEIHIRNLQLVMFTSEFERINIMKVGTKEKTKTFTEAAKGMNDPFILI